VQQGTGAALITGASSGIGFYLAGEFARHGHDVVLVARQEVRLQTLAGELTERYGVQATAIAADLARRKAPARLADDLSTRGLAVDILVNNAGFGAQGRFDLLPMDRQLDMLQVNVVSLTHLTRLLLPGMVARGHGRVLNVASTAAFFPGPLMAVYYASKAYVLSFSEALHVELVDTGVTVTTLCPGPTRTSFQANASMHQSRMLQAPLQMSAATVARAGYEGAMRGERLVIPGAFNKTSALLPRLLPRGLVPRITRYFNKRTDR